MKVTEPTKYALSCCRSKDLEIEKLAELRESFFTGLKKSPLKPPYTWSTTLSGVTLHACALPPACCWFPAPRWGKRHSWRWQTWCGSVPGCSSGRRSSSAAFPPRSDGVSARGTVRGHGFAFWQQPAQRLLLRVHLWRSVKDCNSLGL